MSVRDGGDTVPMKRGRHDPARVVGPRAPSRSSRRLAARVAMIALATAGAVVLVGGADAFWLCLPGVLLAAAWSTTWIGAALSTAAITGAAAAPLAGWLHDQRLRSPLLALLVASASAAVVVLTRERLERERDALRDIALTDPLTGIANRRSLLTRADYEIARHKRGERSFAFVMLDLDGFKLLNDRFGHAAGDELLCDVAASLRGAIRAQDTVARIGGDEFCVLAPETDAVGTLRLVARIADAVGEATAGVETLRASIGVAIFPEDGITGPELFRAADERLLDAKRARRNRRSRRHAA